MYFRFSDDVMFAPTIGLAKATPVGRMLKVTHRGSEPGEKSDACHCRVTKFEVCPIKSVRRAVWRWPCPVSKRLAKQLSKN